MSTNTSEPPKRQKPRRRAAVKAKKRSFNLVPKDFQRNWGLYLIGFAVLASMDAFSAGVISLTNKITYPLFGHQIHLSIFEVIYCFGAGVLAFIGGTAIAKWKNDPRKNQQARIVGARMLIVVILLVGPVPYFGRALTHVDRHGAWTEYSGSKLEAKDEVILSRPVDYGEDAVAEAQKRYKASVEPKHAALDPLWAIVAALMYAAAVFSAEIFFVVAPETASQRQERRQAERRLERERERRTAEERAEAERRRAQSLKAVILDFVTGKRREAA